MNPQTEMAESPANFNSKRCHASDSGYATASGSGSTTTLSSPKNEESIPQTKVNDTRIPYNLPVSGGLKSFDLPADEAVTKRFEDLINRIEPPLIEYVRKHRKRHSPISIRLAFLGKSEHDAKAWIVVFCDEKQLSRLRRFFRKNYVKQMYQPKDNSFPHFELHLEGRAPQLRGVTAWREKNSGTGDTLCGTIITFDNNEGASNRAYVEGAGWTPMQSATLGGVLKLTMLGDSYLLYGMTVDHVGREPDDEDEVFAEDSEESSDEASENEEGQTDKLDALNKSKFGDEISRLLKGVFSEDDKKATHLTGPETPTRKKARLSKSAELNAPSVATKVWEPIGTAQISQAHDYGYDWTLIKVDKTVIKPNLLPSQSGQHNRSADLKVPLRPLRSSEKLPVVMLSGPQGPKHGKLSALPSKLLLGNGHKFVDTYILTLNGMDDICNGDSGSWIVNEATLEVHGHLVASDPFGDAYIIPLQSTFKDIKATFGAESVELPSTLDILCFSEYTDPSFFDLNMDEKSGNFEESFAPLMCFNESGSGSINNFSPRKDDRVHSVSTPPTDSGCNSHQPSMGRTQPLKRRAPDSGYRSAATTPQKRARLDNEDEEDGGLECIRSIYP